MKDLILKLASLIGVSETLAWVISGGALVFLIAVVIAIVSVCKKNARLRKQEGDFYKEAEKEFATSSDEKETVGQEPVQEPVAREEVVVEEKKPVVEKKEKATATKKEFSKKNNINDYNHIWLGYPLSNNNEFLLTSKMLDDSISLQIENDINYHDNSVMSVDLSASGADLCVAKLFVQQNYSIWLEKETISWSESDTDVTKGKILIDGKDVQKYSLESLRDRIGIVAQDVFLFAGSIRENIAFGRLDASEEEIIQACKKANIYEFVMNTLLFY